MGFFRKKGHFLANRDMGRFEGFHRFFRKKGVKKWSKRSIFGSISDPGFFKFLTI